MTTGAERGRLREVLRPALFGGVFFGPVVQASDVLLFGEVWSWFGAVVRSVFFAVAMGVGQAGQLLFSATARERADVARAVSAGVLPEDADGEWRGRLTAERRRLQANRTVVPSLAGLAAVLVVVVTLLPQGPGGAGWVLAAGVALVGGLLTVRERSRLRTVERMLGELPASEGESAHVGDRPPSA